MRLLLVDDDEVLRCLVGEYLTLEGHRVDTAVDGINALASIEANGYDAVICDLEMPRMNGLSLCRALRAGAPARDLYFIMLTGRSSTAAVAESFEAGVDAFITKPCEPADLLAALRTAQTITGLPGPSALQLP